MTRPERILEVAGSLRLGPAGWSLDSLGQLGMYGEGDPPSRFLLVERNLGSARRAQPVYLSTHDGPRAASDYHAGQEYVEDWEPVKLVDLDTGDEWAAEVRVEITWAGDPQIVPTVPHPERAEHRPCAGCGERIAAGQLYLIEAPFHIGCAPKS